MSRVRARRERALARALDEAARALEADAERLKQDAQSRAALADWLEKLAALPGIVAEVRRLEAQGAPDAAARVAAIHEVPLPTLLHYIGLEDRTDAKARRWQRDREIMRLAWAGSTNAEIAARIGGNLHPKSVSRIIGQRLRGKRRSYDITLRLPPARPTVPQGARPLAAPDTSPPTAPPCA